MRYQNKPKHITSCSHEPDNITLLQVPQHMWCIDRICNCVWQWRVIDVWCCACGVVQERKSITKQGLRVRRLSGDALREEGDKMWV